MNVSLFAVLAIGLIACLAAVAADGRVTGTLRDAKGKAIPGATVYLARGEACLTVPGDREGRFAIEGVKPDTYDYLAVSVPLDGKRFPYLYARKALVVKEGETVRVDVAYAPVQPPTSASPPADAPPEMAGPDGTMRTQFRDVAIWNPFNWNWERQRVGFRVQFAGGAAPDSVLVYDCTTKTQVPYQVSDAVLLKSNPLLLSEATVHFFAEVKEQSRPSWRIYYGTDKYAPAPGAMPITVQEDGAILTIDAGKIAARLPCGKQQLALSYDPGIAPAPLLAVRGGDKVWRGAGRLIAPAKVTTMEAQIIRQGPIFIDYQVRYTFANNATYAITFHFEAGTGHFTAREESSGFDGAAFEFSMAGNFGPDNGFKIHFGGDGVRDITPLKYDADSTLALIPNYTHIHPFGYAVSSTRPDVTDTLAVFSVNRGAWIDRRYAAATWFPLRNAPDGQMQMPWTNYYGSPYSAIEVAQRKSGDLLFRFPLHDGTREWGLAIFPKELNDKPAVVHGLNAKNGYIRELHIRVGDLPLDKFKDYTLTWETKPVTRPRLNYGLDALPRMQANLKEPAFAALWKQEGSPLFKAFASGDPRLAWKAATAWRRDLLEGWVIPTLRGHDLGHVPYNQVSVRGLVDMCEMYDLLEPSGVFSPDELAAIRAGLAVLGYRFNDRNFMCWQYNQGQQDFDAARLAGVASVGFTLPDHPQAQAWTNEAIQRQLDLLYVFQLPGGKWPENTPCYYQQTFCNFTYLAHQARQAGRDEMVRSADFQDFVRWTLLNLTPPHPSDPDIMRRGLPAGTMYADLVRTRHLPGIGDHGGPGGVEIKYDAALIAQDLRQAAPDLAGEMIWAFNRGGLPALMGRNAPPVNTTQMVPPRLLLACLTPADLRAEKRPALDSRLLPGFGAVMRADADTPAESFLLYRCGSSGVRYAHSENVVHFTYKGVPLLIDGFDQRENSTVLRADGGGFGPGRIVRFRSNEWFDYALGESPVGTAEVRRHVLLMKNAFAVIADESLVDEPLISRLVVLADDARKEDDSKRIRFIGRLGTDLETHITSSPGAEVQVGDTRMLWEGRPETDGIILKKVEVKYPGQGDCRMLLLPHEPGDTPKTQIEPLGPGFRVVRGGEVDIVFVGKRAAFTGNGVRFDGACGIASWRDDGLRLHLVDGALLEAGGVTLRLAGGSATLHRQGEKSFTLVVEDGPATVFVGSSTITPGKVQLTCDGKTVTSATFQDGLLMLKAPEGKHTYTILCR